MRIDLCKRGHAWDEANTRWVLSYKGRPMRQCRACIRYLKKLRYGRDDAWREQQKAKALGRYYRRQGRIECRP